MKNAEKIKERNREYYLKILTAYNEFSELGLVKPAKDYHERRKIGRVILQELQNEKGNENV